MADRARVAALQLRKVQSRQISTSVGRVHVLDAAGTGSLPPVVLLHGLSAAAVDYGPLIQRLRSCSRRVIAPDLPGHGLSSSPSDSARWEADFDTAVAQAVGRTLDEPAIVFGNSLGGLMAIRYALRRPRNVRGLFLASPGGAPSTAEQRARLRGLFHLDSHAKARAFIERAMPSKRSNRWLLAWGARVRLGRRPVRELIRRAGSSHELTPKMLAALEMPLLVSWGTAERVLPDSHRRFFERHLPRHAIVERPHGEGHAAFLEHPREVAERIVRFTQSVSPA